MDFENLKEGQPIQNPPLFEKQNFLEWKSKLENYVKSIDQDLWHIISIGNLKPTKTSFENQDDQFDLTYELEVLEKLIDKHLVEINTCATSLNVLNEGVSEDDYSCRALNGLAYNSWYYTDEDEANHPVCDSQLDKTSSKVHFETKHFCFDTFILEFSKIENESKLSCNMDLKTIFNNETSKSCVNTFENEIMLEDKMSRLESHVEIDLECKLCLDYKHEIQRQNEKGKMLTKFEESSKVLECCLKSQKSFRDRTGLGFNSKEPSTSKTKQVVFVKPRREL